VHQRTDDIARGEDRSRKAADNDGGNYPAARAHRLFRYLHRAFGKRIDGRAGDKGEHRDEGEDGDHGDILNEQDRQRGPAGIGAGQRPLGDRLHGDGGRGHRERQPDDQRRLPVKADGERDAGENHGRCRHLHEPQAEHLVAHAP
jgi:hypothetical protein